jgi:hypothetical protein
MTKKGTEKKSKHVNWKKAALELATCVDFALRYHKHLGRGSGIMINLKTMKPEGKRWQERFFDAMSMIGIEYDRDGYYKNLDKGRRRA